MSGPPKGKNLTSRIPSQKTLLPGREIASTVGDFHAEGKRKDAVSKLQKNGPKKKPMRQGKGASGRAKRAVPATLETRKKTRGRPSKGEGKTS